MPNRIGPRFLNTGRAKGLRAWPATLTHRQPASFINPRRVQSHIIWATFCPLDPGVVLRLTDHAEREIRRRAIAPVWVEATIATPDWTMPDPRDPGLTRSFKAIPAFGNGVLRVVHRPDGDDMLVITAHFDRGAKR